jgi:hypothetical protein
MRPDDVRMYIAVMAASKATQCVRGGSAADLDPGIMSEIPVFRQGF